MTKVPKVFISYSHDSRAHQDVVLGLSDRLRSDGIDCHIDQYEVAPPEGWSAWMERHITEADFVLVVCTAPYRRRFDGNEGPRVGRGVKWESMLMRVDLYRNDTLNAKFIPILFAGASEEDVPSPLYEVNRYELLSDEGYLGLLRRLLGIPQAQKPPLGLQPTEDELGGMRGTALPLFERKPGFFDPAMDADRSVCIEKLVEVLADGRVATAIRDGLEISAADGTTLADALLGMAEDDAVQLTEQLMHVAEDLYESGAAGDIRAKRPFTQLLQWLLPTVWAQAHDLDWQERKDGAFVAVRSSNVRIESMMARVSRRKAYFRLFKEEVLGRNGRPVTPAEQGINAPRQALIDLGHWLAPQVGRPFDVDASSTDKQIEVALGIVNGGLARAARLAASRPKRYEETWHRFYVVVPQTGQSEDVVARIRGALSELGIVLVTPDAVALERSVREQDVHDNVRAVMKLECHLEREDKDDRTSTSGA